MRHVLLILLGIVSLPLIAAGAVVYLACAALGACFYYVGELAWDGIVGVWRK